MDTILIIVVIQPIIPTPFSLVQSLSRVRLFATPVSTQYHAISHSVVWCCSQPALSMGLTSMADYLLYPAILYKELNSSGYQNPWILKDDCISLLLILLTGIIYLCLVVCIFHPSVSRSLD